MLQTFVQTVAVSNQRIAIAAVRFYLSLPLCLQISAWNWNSRSLHTQNIVTAELFGWEEREKNYSNMFTSIISTEPNTAVISLN